MNKPFALKSRHRGRGVGTVCLLALLLGWAPAAWAELQFDVFVGYGLGANEGAVAEGGWFPVFCEIYNDGPAFSGVVSLGSSHSGEKYRVAVELPTGTRKRLLVPFYCSGRYLTLDAELRDAKGKVKATRNQLRPYRIADRHSPLIGSLSRTIAGSVLLPDIQQSPSRLQPAVARLSVELFPDHVMALDGLSSLYLHSSRAAELKPPQANALQAWLHSGGHLILGVEQPGDVNATPWLASLLPCEITGIASRVGHAELQAWLNSDARRPGPGQVPSGKGRGGTGKQPQPEGPLDQNPFARLAEDAAFEGAALPVALATVRDGRVILGRKDAPLAIQCARGRGTLTVLLFSPDLEPFKSWPHRHWFWAKLTGVPIEWLAGWNFNPAGGNHIDGVFGAITDSKQIRKLPVVWLFVLLLGYLAVIGPVDQYMLKKLNKQMLTWITFPAYVVFFSVLIYYIGYRLRAGEAEWNEFHVVDVIPHGERADLRGRTYGSVYSPVNAQYPVASEAPSATLRGELGYSGGQEISKATIEPQGNSFKALLTAPIWTSQLYLSDWWRQAPVPLRVTVSPSTNNQFEVKLENLTKHKIPQAKLLFEGRVYNVGEIPRSRTQVLSRNSGVSAAEFARGQSSHFAEVVNTRHSQWSRGETEGITDPFAAAVAASFLGEEQQETQNQPYPNYRPGLVTFRGLDLTLNAARGDLILFAWIPDDLIVSPLNKFTPRRSHHYTVLRLVVPAK
jgi:hypothetical protein